MCNTFDRHLLCTALAAATLSLAACSEAPDAPPLDAPGQAEPDETTDPPRSIIREEVDPDVARQPLMPLEVSISFADNGTQLDKAAREVLAQAIASPQMAAGGPIILAGHTDSIGTDSANLRVSRQRAEAVQAYLIKAGIEEDRITLIPLGEMRPLAPNALPDGNPDEAGRAANRRVEMVVELAPKADEPA
ncbi:MAG: OmpA family protein [Sphingomonadaceae bacterium]|nr:OmpA family protein [Sphingomonadaceae bacterium]